MKRIWEAAVSLRTTAILLVVLFVLLLLTVLVPQAAHAPGEYAAALRSGGWARFTLETLGLGRIVTGGPFLATIGLFFANLIAVLVDRAGNTLRRVRFAVPSRAQVDALLASREAAHASSATGASIEEVEAALRTLGYRTARVEGRAWGVKNRFALLGFPLFHASFLFLCAGAITLSLTRSVATLIAAEGQTVSTLSGHVARYGELLPPVDALLRVESVDVRLADGKPIELGARIVLSDAGVPQDARVNHPAVWGDLTVLVQRAGIAPVLWLQDSGGYTRDRVVVPSASPSGLPTRVPLAGGALEVAVEHLAIGRGFPTREELPRAAVPMRVSAGGRTLFEGALRPGERVLAGELTLTLDEVRYWVGLRLVRERGGGLLVVGFVLTVVGILWRMMWARGEVAVAWEPPGLQLAARAEFVASRARSDLVDVLRLLERAEGPGRQS